jgi:hypothetical protein
MTRLEEVARRMWQSCQYATGMHEFWASLPKETRDFWMAEARDVVLGIGKDISHHLTRPAFGRDHIGGSAAFNEILTAIVDQADGNGIRHIF